MTRRRVGRPMARAYFPDMGTLRMSRFAGYSRGPDVETVCMKFYRCKKFESMTPEADGPANGSGPILSYGRFRKTGVNPGGL